MKYKHSVTFWRGNVRRVMVFDTPKQALHFARSCHPSQDAWLDVVPDPDRLPTSTDAWPVVTLYMVGLALCVFAWCWFGA